MKKTKKLFVCAMCILLSVIIASATLMVGATDEAVTEKTTVPATAVVTTEPAKDVDEILSEFVSENDLQDDFSEVGDGIKNFSQTMSKILSDFISALEDASERLVEFLKQVFRLGTFD